MKFSASLLLRFRASILASGLGLVLALTLAPRMAAAQDSPARPLTWSPEWRPVRRWEYVATLLTGAAALTLQFAATPPVTARWSGGLLFDDFARDHLRAGTAAGRNRARKVSDLTWYSGTAVPFLVDLPVAFIRGNGVGGPILWMDLEAFAVAGLINRAFELEMGRARPGRDRCATADADEYSCGTPDGNVSMPSGHTLVMATAAGLTCVHHRYLPLWGGPTADAAACGLLSVATVVTGTARIMADRHYATDVLTGTLIGFGVGYTLPWLLHYRHGTGDSETSLPIILPVASETGFGVTGMMSF